MKNLIKLNSEISIDLPKLIDSRLLVQANSGGGKSWLLRRLLEQSHGKVQQIVIDLEGEFATLREKHEYVLAGKGGDTPADPRSAGMLALKLLEHKASAIIDLYELQHQDRKRFVRLFLEAMINAPKELWHPVMVVIDEAHVFVPEKGESEAAEAVIDLATRGRKRGFCAVLATQRLSKLHKDAAAECNNKLVGRTGLDIDMKRAAEELGFNTKEQYLSLRGLEAGEFFAFGPAISTEVKKVKIGNVQTSHPKAGSRSLIVPPPPTDKIKKILAKLGDLPAEAKKEAQTLAEMKQEIATLRRHKCAPGVDQKQIDIALQKQAAEFNRERKQWHQYIDVLMKWFERRPLPAVGPIQTAPTTYMGMPLRVDKEQPKSFAKMVTDREIVTIPTGEMGKGERAILIAAAQYPQGISREHLTVMTGYKRSSRDAYIQRLRVRQFVNMAGDFIVPTQDGIAALGSDYKELPTGEALREYYMRELPEGEKKMLGILIEAYPQAVDREALSNATNYQRSSRDAYLQRLTARQLITLEGRGMVKASDKLFEL